MKPEVLVPLIFIIVIVMFIVTAVKGISQWSKNNNSPRVTADATVVAKRNRVWGDHSHTDYYATFQFESGDRLELVVPHNQFGYLVEGDHGKLTFQGSRFVSFERM